MNNSELYKLLCECLFCDENPNSINSIREKISSNQSDINRLIHFSSNHLVLTTLFRQLKASGIIELFPDDLSEHLNEIYELNTKRNLEILQQIDEINYQLEKEDIQPVYLKGTANLMDGLYRSQGDRLIGDIDFLVQEKEYVRTIELFLKLGFKSQMKMYFDIKDQKHYPALFRNDLPAKIEIHRSPVNREYEKNFSTESIFASKTEIPGKTNCFVPCDRHKIIHTFMHSQLIDKAHVFKTLPLRNLYDFHLLSKRVKWEEVINTIEEKRKAQIFFDNVALLSDSSPIPITNRESRNFYIQYNWLLNHNKIHRIYILLVKTTHFLILKIPKLFLSKSMFKSLLNRIKDRDWWKNRLLKGIREHLS